MMVTPLSVLSPPSAGPALPLGRGPLSDLVIERLARPPHELPAAPLAGTGDALADDDLQLALYVLYELHYRSFAGVDPDWEWEPSLIRLRAELEGAFESALREWAGDAPDAGDVAG